MDPSPVGGPVRRHRLDGPRAAPVRNPRESILTVVKPDCEVKLDKNGSIFRVNIDVETNKSVGFEALNGLKITWNVVLEGFRNVFTMMDCEGERSFVMGLEGWFSKELQSAGCCSGGIAACRLVVELRVGLRESGGNMVASGEYEFGALEYSEWEM